MPSARGKPPEPEPPDPRSAEEIFVAAYELASSGDPELWPRATRLFEQAAARGHIEAQFALTVALREGRGVEADPAAALVWLRLAAEGGHAGAQNQLGCRLCQLSEAPPVLAEARSWYERAAAAGNAEAMLNLGLLHEEGRGAPHDLEAAVRWYRAAAVRGLDEAADCLENLGVDASRESLRAATTYEPPPVRKQESLEVLRAAAEAGDIDVQVRLTARLLKSGTDGHAREAVLCRSSVLPSRLSTKSGRSRPPRRSGVGPPVPEALSPRQVC